MTDTVTLALPSKGAIAEPALNFLRDCGLRVEKPNPRQYTGHVPAIPQLEVLFQRVIDVQYKVADGTAQLGITGLDVVHEYADEDVIVIHNDLGFGECKLLVAAPEAWIDVTGMADLADVALDMRENQRRNLRIATTYPVMTRRFFHAHGLHHFTIVQGEGAIEAAPTIGYADAIVDLTQTGTTLRENNLRPLNDGVILESQACLIGNRSHLRENPGVRAAARVLLEYIDATLQGKRYSQVTVNLRAASIDEVVRKLAADPVTRGLQGPTIAPIYGAHGGDEAQWITITLIMANKALLQGIDALRRVGATDVVVTPVRYLFLESSPTYQALCQALDLSDGYPK